MPAYYLEAAVIALGIILLILEAFTGKGNKAVIAWLGIIGLLGVFVALFFVQGPEEGTTSPIWSFYAVDAPSLFFKGFALITTILVLLMSLDYGTVLQSYLKADQEHSQAGLGEFFYLPLFTCAGLMWMASAQDLVSIFVSLELVTISFYVLVAFMRRNVGSLEAGVKYLILGALSTGFFVYGLTWIFGLTGETQLVEIRAAIQDEGGLMRQYPMALMFALGLVLVGLGFKIAAVPFQVWVPDVYLGAATPVTAFLSVGSKAAGFVVAYRLLEPFLTSGLVPQLAFVLLVIAGATLLFGNFAAIQQSNFKRLLAYSSISHAGFLLLALACLETADEASFSVLGVMALYLAGYLAMTLLSFHVMCLVRSQLGGEELGTYEGLAKRSPFLAFVLLIAMLSLAGIPFTAGFFGKFYVFLLAVQGQHYLLLILGAIGVAVGFYYYLKVVRAMYWDAAVGDTKIHIPFVSRVVLLLLVAAILFLGVYPAPILNFFA